MYRVWLAQVPVADGLVPAASDQHIVHVLQVVHMSHRRVMLRYNLALICCQIPHLCCLVTAPCSARHAG